MPLSRRTLIAFPRGLLTPDCVSTWPNAKYKPLQGKDVQSLQSTRLLAASLSLQRLSVIWVCLYPVTWPGTTKFTSKLPVYTHTNLWGALYTSVRPHIGYATQVWAPQFIELISKLESIQRRATKFILRLSFSTSIDYRTRLQSLKLLPITYWHEFLDMIFFYKATHNLVSMNGSVLLVKHVARTTRHTNTVIKFLPYNCKTTTYQIPFSSELVGFGHLSQYH